MKKYYILLLTIMFVTALGIKSYSQTLELEKTYPISKNAKKGALSNVSYDSDKGLYTLNYVTKAKKTSAVIETYTFDKDFNYKDMTQQEVEFDKAKSSFKWWKLRSENYDVEGITADPNGSGNMVLRKYRISYGFDWLTLNYTKKIKTLDKVKLKTEEGNKYYYQASADDNNTGEIYVICGINDKKDKDSFGKNLHLLEINDALNVVKDIPIKVDFPQDCAYLSLLLNKDDASFAGLICVLAPSSSGATKDPDNSNYTYLRFNNSLHETERINFKSPSSYWKIEDMLWTVKNKNEADEIYLIGPSAGKSESYFNTIEGTEKFNFFQLMKIKNKKVDYLTETNLGEFEAKLKVPPSQKAKPVYRGKKFQLIDDIVTKDGELIIIGQNWSTKFNMVDKEFHDVYGDIIAFHFDKDGKLKAQYGYDTKEYNAYTKENGTPQDIMEGKENIFWMVKEAKGNGLMYPCIGKINAKEGTINNFIVFGNKDYYLESSFPYLKTDSDNKIVLFGTDKRGKTLWFARLNLD